MPLSKLILASDQPIDAKLEKDNSYHLGVHMDFFLQNPWLIILVSMIPTAIAYYYFAKRIRDIKVISATPTTKLANSRGYVELVGIQHAWNTNPLLSNLKKTKCTWYSYKIEKRVTRRDSKGRTSSTWRNIESDKSNAPLVFGDGSGYCLIDPEDANVFPIKKRQWYGSYESPGRKSQGMLGAIAEVAMHLGGRRYRFTEWVMLPETYLYAIGNLDDVDASDSTVQFWISSYPDLQHIVKDVRVKVLSGKNVPENKPFILSAKSEEDLIKHNKISAMALLVLTLLLLVLNIYLIKYFYFD